MAQRSPFGRLVWFASFLRSIFMLVVRSSINRRTLIRASLSGIGLSELFSGLPLSGILSPLSPACLFGRPAFLLTHCKLASCNCDAHEAVPLVVSWRQRSAWWIPTKQPVSPTVPPLLASLFFFKKARPLFSKCAVTQFLTLWKCCGRRWRECDTAPTNARFVLSNVSIGQATLTCAVDRTASAHLHALSQPPWRRCGASVGSLVRTFWLRLDCASSIDLMHRWSFLLIWPLTYRPCHGLPRRCHSRLSISSGCREVFAPSSLTFCGCCGAYLPLFVSCIVRNGCRRPGPWWSPCADLWMSVFSPKPSCSP